MAFSTSDVTAKVRRIIGDNFEPYRWEDAEIREHLQTAIKRLNVNVPSTRYIFEDMVDYIELPDDADADIQIHDSYEEALVYYVVHLCYTKDDPDTSNAELSAAYFTRADGLMR